MNPTIKKPFKTSLYFTSGYFMLSGICIFTGYSGSFCTVLLFPLLLSFGLAYAGFTGIFFSGILVFGAVWLVFYVVIVLCTSKVTKPEDEPKK